MILTSRERVLAAFRHQEPDRVPAWLGASPEWKQLAREHLSLPDDEALLRYLGDDFRRVFSRYAGPPERSPGEMLSPGATWRSGRLAMAPWNTAGSPGPPIRPTT